MEDKIDIHERSVKYDRALSKLEVDESVIPRNRELILKFLWDCKVGKTLLGRAKKKIGKARLLKYVCALRSLSKWLGKPFDEVTKEDMEKFVVDLDENVYKKEHVYRDGRTNYSEETKLDFKKALRKLYKWLGKPEIVEFMDMSFEQRDIPAITREEAEKLVNSVDSACIKAAIMVMFDGGTRAEEFLNLRMKDVTKRKYQNENECYWINIRYSKTFSRTIPLPLCSKYLGEWLREHPEKDNPEALVFPFKYPAFRKRLKTLAKKVLKKNLTPHMLRHSSATYWAPKMNRHILCAKYGWAFSSNMPDRYIKRKGIIFEQIAEKGDVDQTTKLERENRVLKEKMEDLERGYTKLKKAMEFVLPALYEKMDEQDFQRTLFEKRKEQVMLEHQEGKRDLEESEFRVCRKTS